MSGALPCYPCESLVEGIAYEKALKAQRQDGVIQIRIGQRSYWYVWHDGKLLAVFHSDAELRRYLRRVDKAESAPSVPAEKLPNPWKGGEATPSRAMRRAKLLWRGLFVIALCVGAATHFVLGW